MYRRHPLLLRDLLLATSCLVASGVLAVSAAHASGPSDGKVVSGSATISSNGLDTIINQSSKKALINWQSFSIPSGSSVSFNQPNAGSLTVNRVVGPDSSQIFGNLLATGRVWLINSNGILFGKGSQINVGSLIATTSDITDDDFRHGKNRFSVSSSNPNASVVNQGTIHAADHGSVVLSGASVSNQGVIQANLGTVVLGGASAFTVDLNGDNLIRYQVTKPVSQTPQNSDGSTAAALVANSGTITANGGKVLMTARAARNVEDNVVNNTGIVEATSVSSHNGEIVLDAGDGGTVNAGGTLDASGKATGQTGGTVTLTGSTVAVADGATIDASGDRGGGTVLIGGNFHGSGTLQQATTTTIGNATITADAISNGNGGRVAVWSQGNTSFAGHISAKGGAQGGSGGFVETSGKNLNVSPSATVATMAAHGATGTWLLDPENIDIVNGGGDGLNGSNIDPQTIINALGSTNVELEATNDITIDSDVIYNSGNAFTLLAENNINAYASVSNGGAGAINLVAGWDGETTDLGSLTNPGVYGNNGGSVFIGTDSAHGNVAIGSFGGLTTVEGADVEVESDNGYAQIGYHGAGGGNIDVLGTGDISVVSNIENTAQIGNGGTDVAGAITGDISLTTTGGDVVVASDEDTQQFSDYSIATIGNLGGDGSSQSGDLAINTNGGSLTLAAVGDASIVHVGNWTHGQTFDGSTSGDIRIDAGAVQLFAGSDVGLADWAEIGTGTFSGCGCNTGDLSGNITINAQSLLMAASPGSDASNTQARIGDLGQGGTVTGDINITTTGDVDLLANGSTAGFSGVASIGGVSLMNDSNGNPLPGEGSGDVTINAGGQLVLAAQDGGNARIEAGGWNNGTMSVTAQGNILMQTSGDGESGSGLAFIGTLTGDMDIRVTSVTGSIEIDANEDNSTAAIGNSDNGVQQAISGNVTVTAADPENGNIFLGASGSNSSVWIGNQSFADSPVSGNISIVGNSLDLAAANSGASVQIGNVGYGSTGPVSGDITLNIAGTTTLDNTQGTTWIGNIAGEGNAETGNVTWVTGNLFIAGDEDSRTVGTNDILGQIISADLGSSDSTGGDFTLALTNPDTAVISRYFAQGLTYSSPHDLSFLSTGSLTFASSVQNNGSGALTAIAGWNTDVVSADQLIADGAGSVLNTAGAYGGTNPGFVWLVGLTGNVLDYQTNGGVAVDSGAGTAFGSKGGTTSVAGQTVLVEGLSGFAQVGYLGQGGTGAIDVAAFGTVGLGDAKVNPPSGAIGAFYSGSRDQGGNDASACFTGGGICVIGGRPGFENSGAYAQIGDTSTGSGGADINVTASGSISVAGGGMYSSNSDTMVPGTYGQIGNGSADLTRDVGNESGDIFVQAGGQMYFGSSQEPTSVAWLGNRTSATESGNVTLVSATENDNGPIDLGDMIKADLGTSEETGGDFTYGHTGAETINVGTQNFFSSPHTVSLLSAGDIDVEGSIENSGSGAINVVAGWDGHTLDSSQFGDAGVFGNNSGSVLIGGDSAQGGAVIGSAGGTTSIFADNVTLSATNGFAQIGFHGAGTGSIDIQAAGDVSLNGGSGTVDFAQIGHGGFQIDGSNSGDITVDAQGAILLAGGTGEEAYAQIGHGGGESNVASEGYSNTGLITVSGDSVTLDGGQGTASYAQIGHGGFQSGFNLTGAGSDTGDITVDSQTIVSLLGGADDAYAQIGNGGDQVNAHSGAQASGTLGGNITVTALQQNGITQQGGTGGNAYTQIGNGGFGSNADTAAPASNFTVSGNIVVSDLTLIGSDTAEDAYAQIGNGDASQNNVGNISGNISISGDVTETNGSATGSSALIGNATGNGTVTGTVTGFTPPGSGETSGDAGTIAALVQTVETITFTAPEEPASFPVEDDFTTAGVETVADTSTTPLEQLSDNGSSTSEGNEPSDKVANSVGHSLNGKRNKAVRVAQTVIPGLLKQIVLVNPARPHGVPPANQDYSSWGNEAFWQW